MTRLANVGDGALASIAGSVTVCQCEGLTRATLDARSTTAATTINDLKAATRCGMGPCGGRLCEDAAARLIALRTGGRAHADRPGDRAAAAASGRSRHARRRLRLRRAADRRARRRSDRPRVTDRFDLVVIGAGIMGATAALRAAQGGMRVIVVERDGAGSGASGVNAGTLSLQIKRVRLMPYALRGHAWWRDAGDAVGFKRTGGYTLAFNAREQALLEERMTLKRAAGAPIEFMSPARGARARAGADRSHRRRELLRRGRPRRLDAHRRRTCAACCATPVSSCASTRRCTSIDAGDGGFRVSTPRTAHSPAGAC